MFEDNPLLEPRKEFNRNSPDYVNHSYKGVQQLEQPFGFIFCLNLKRQAEFALMNWLKDKPDSQDAQALLNCIMLTQDYIFDTASMELGYATQIENDSAEKLFEQIKELIAQVATQNNPTIKPVESYLINGPIPPDGLAHLDIVQVYVDHVGSTLSIHFMFESISIHGKPEWWKGSIAEFNAEFHEQYQIMLRDIDKDSEIVWSAAQDEVQAKRLSPLLEDATKEQVEDFLHQGMKRLEQTLAVELLLTMWAEAREKE